VDFVVCTLGVEKKIRAGFDMSDQTIPLSDQQLALLTHYYAVEECLHKILSSLVGNIGSFMMDSEHFIKSIQDINLQTEDYLVSFVSLFTNVPVEVLQVIRNRFSTEPSFPECSPLRVEDVMELTDVCLTTMYFQFEDKFYQQKEGMAMGNFLSPVISNLFMEHFEEIALDTADYKPTKWFGYVNDTFVV
jgi:hypothetical protein